MRGPDWLIVGAGFTGSVLAERIASQLGKRVLLVDRRTHVGGNAHDEVDEQGVRIHTYGPHIFHTNSDRIWAYLSRFTAWRRYEHRVLGMIDDQLVPIPFNLTTLRMMIPDRAQALETALIREYGKGAKVAIMSMREHADAQLRGLADLIYTKIFLNYTIKQWGLAPSELDRSVTARVPVLVSTDDRYFQDRHQAMPVHGYSALFERMLDSDLIEVATSTDFDAAMADKPKHVIFTGPIDEFFAHMYGPLEYRTLRFEFEAKQQPLHQPVGTINFPNDFAYTRTTEFKHITGQVSGTTTIVREFPEAHRPSVTEPYYPVPRPANRERFEHYAREARKLTEHVVFAGRLADYRYYNMDQAVGRALTTFEKVVVPLSRGRKPLPVNDGMEAARDG